MSHINPYQPSKSQPPIQFKHGGKMGPKPKNYMVEAILLFLCCSGLIAIPAIVFAAQVDSKYNSGDYSGALKNSEQAKTWCLVALGCGLLCNTLIFALAFVGESLEGGGF